MVKTNQGEGEAPVSAPAPVSVKSTKRKCREWEWLAEWAEEPEYPRTLEGDKHRKAIEELGWRICGLIREVESKDEEARKDKAAWEQAVDKAVSDFKKSPTEVSEQEPRDLLANCVQRYLFDYETAIHGVFLKTKRFAEKDTTESRDWWRCEVEDSLCEEYLKPFCNTEWEKWPEGVVEAIAMALPATFKRVD